MHSVAGRLNEAGDRLRRVNAQPPKRGLSAQDLQKVLEVTRALAAPFDLMTMLSEVTAAARQVLHADRASVWLHDAAANQLVLKVATDVQDVRIPVGTGMVGACARVVHAAEEPVKTAPGGAAGALITPAVAVRYCAASPATRLAPRDALEARSRA
jgi:hypothetical protein